MAEHPCLYCGKEMLGSHIGRKYCSRKCKAAYYRTHTAGHITDGHICRTCGKHFPLKSGQGNKWYCSDECRKAAVAKSAREFYLRHPQMEKIYRTRTREKLGPDSNVKRFYKWNPNAPRACESCGETRVLEIAHRPECARIGGYRNKANYKWPEKVWVLCPTCHQLLDRMNYTPAELGLI